MAQSVAATAAPQPAAMTAFSVAGAPSLTPLPNRPPHGTFLVHMLAVLQSRLGYIPVLRSMFVCYLVDCCQYCCHNSHESAMHTSLLACDSPPYGCIGMCLFLAQGVNMQHECNGVIPGTAPIARTVLCRALLKISAKRHVMPHHLLPPPAKLWTLQMEPCLQVSRQLLSSSPPSSSKHTRMATHSAF